MNEQISNVAGPVPVKTGASSHPFALVACFAAKRAWLALFALALAIALLPFAQAFADDAIETDEATSQTIEVSAESSEDGDCANSWRFTNGKLKGGTTLEQSIGTQSQKTPKAGIATLIDVSKWDGKINWKKVKASGIKYAIIRVGWGENDKSQDDKYFSYNVQQARANGIKIGVYIYSYAYTTDKAKSEANHVLRLLKSESLTSSKLALPVYYDLEEQAGTSKPCVKSGGTKHTISNSDLGKIASTFAGVITKAGYKMGVYANKNWWNNFLTASQFKNSSWSKWVAQYPSTVKTTSTCSYKGTYDIWQYSSSGTVSGISTKVDMNRLFRNFDAKIATAAVDVSDVEYPSKVPQGYGAELSGTITSTATMKSLTVKILAGSTVKQTVTVKPGAKSYNLSSLKGLDFSKLATSTSENAKYTIQILVTIENAQKQVLSEDFVVTSSKAIASNASTDQVDDDDCVTAIDYTRPKFGVSSMSLSSGVTKGKSYTFSGKVTSTVSLTKVKATLVSKTTGATIATWTGTASGKSFKLPSAMTSKFNTKNLPMGQYYFKIVGYSSSASGTAVSKTFTIGPDAPSSVKMASKSKKHFTASWAKNSGAKGYQIRYSRYSSMKSDYFKTTTSTSKTIKVKKSKHNYYMQVRSYKLVKGVKCYGSWTSIKKAKVK